MIQVAFVWRYGCSQYIPPFPSLAASVKSMWVGTPYVDLFGSSASNQREGLISMQLAASTYVGEKSEIECAVYRHKNLCG
jgi:hypothetical protein